MGESSEVVLPLLRGTIHECDRILRNWADDDKVPASFYLTYGSALFDLGTMLDDKDLDSYMEAAKERFETGLEHLQESKQVEKSEKTKNKLNVALAKWFLVDVC